MPWSALAAVPLARQRRAAPGGQALLALPFLVLALACWALLFTFSEPLWRLVPALVPDAVAQAPARPARHLRRRRRRRGSGCPAGVAGGAGRSPRSRAVGWGVAGLATGAVLVQRPRRPGGAPLPRPKRPMDGRMIVQEEKDSFSHIGTTSGGEFTPRDVQIATYTAGQRRGRSVFERLYPEREWIGGLFHPLSGDLRFLGLAHGAPAAEPARGERFRPRPARLGVRQFRFPGWRAWVDGRRVPVDVAPYIPEQQAALGFIVLDVPPGEHAINVALGPTPPRLAGMGLALPRAAGAGRARAARWTRGVARTSGWPAALLAGGLPACRRSAGLRRLAGRSPRLRALRRTPGGGRRAPADGVWRAPASPARSGVPAGQSGRGRPHRAGPGGLAQRGDPGPRPLRRRALPDRWPIPTPTGAPPATSRREWLYLHPPSEVSVDVALPAGRTVWFQSVAGPRSRDVGARPRGTACASRLTVAPARRRPAGAGRPRTVLDHTLNPRARDRAAALGAGRGRPLAVGRADGAPDPAHRSRATT